MMSVLFSVSPLISAADCAVNRWNGSVDRSNRVRTIQSTHDKSEWVWNRATGIEPPFSVL